MIKTVCYRAFADAVVDRHLAVAQFHALDDLPQSLALRFRCLQLAPALHHLHVLVEIEHGPFRRPQLRETGL
jgi:hypothetical protein